MSLLAMSQTAGAFENGFVNATIAGITIGAPVGANPPPGIYYVNAASWGTQRGDTGLGASLPPDLHLDLFIETPLLVWSTPWHFLGASVAFAVAQPFANVNVFGGVGPNTISGGFGDAVLVGAGFHNTIVTPVDLSWNLGGGWFVSLAFDAVIPDGTIAGGNGMQNIGAPFWTFEPQFAISYLADGWDLTAHIVYDINTRNTVTNITDGNSIQGDLTATKKFGKWEIGPVGYFFTQTTDDTNLLGGVQFLGPQTGAHGTTVAVGGLVGYNWGPVDLKVFVTDPVFQDNFNDGWRVWTSLSMRLWGPEAPAAAPAMSKMITK